jgi:hypothetical protein
LMICLISLCPLPISGMWLAASTNFSFCTSS